MARLSNLTDEEVALLDSISKKLRPAPAENARQGDPQNQIESKPASEAEVIELGAKAR